MPKITVRYCWGNSPGLLEIAEPCECESTYGPSQADLFKALSGWLRDHPGVTVNAVNIGLDEKCRDFLTVLAGPVTSFTKGP